MIGADSKGGNVNRKVRRCSYTSISGTPKNLEMGSRPRCFYEPDAPLDVRKTGI